MALVAPSGAEPLMDTGAGAGRIPFRRDPGPSCSACFLRVCGGWLLIRGDR